MNFLERNQFLIAMVVVLAIGVYAFQEKDLMMIILTLILAVIVIGFKIYLNVKATRQNKK
ncbi:hypothetical protein [Latilactobacillus fuchuensis]|jgi:nicotinamide riboside transporter PnuC|uniref:Uncharacterized protein n=1 Tax=Latilactobacillus fuchuensis TaxID=164393 RepID=A0A2N9DX01_9LACO|nr:hypothetical protein [Latilactobacillus fuchuensis]MCP8857942.1 hypothetical protein [Latilactobacillus fuchuensis]SPC39209.1 conserved hypothetical protein [Latilactobacillus fuchuensis]